MNIDQRFCKFCREPIRDDGYGEVIHQDTGKYIAVDGKGKEHQATPGGRAKKVKP
jgi:hypothetical protein